MNEYQPIEYDLETCEQLLSDLLLELQQKYYSLDDTIQVMRLKKPLYDNYHPIYFYYPYHDQMLKEFSKPDSPFTPDDLPKNKEFLEQYESERKYLQPILVKEAIFELEEISKLLKS